MLLAIFRRFNPVSQIEKSPAQPAGFFYARPSPADPRSSIFLKMDLFENDSRDQTLGPGAMLLGGFATSRADALLQEIAAITAQAPFRHLVTPGGHTMSVAMTNCGPLGWLSDSRGYRYNGIDPITDRPWPAMPQIFATLAAEAAARAGFARFRPDACLINRYVPGAKLSLHQDKDEDDQTAPIVSVSLGLPAVFQFGGLTRDAPITKYRLQHGDVVVWGGPARFYYHGILPLKDGTHPATGATRINMTFRKVRN